MDDIPDGYSSMFQAIQGRVPGVTVIGNGVQIRGISSIMGDTSPLYLVDGEAVDASTFGALNPRDVEMVEFLKGSSASIYGIRGSNGVIAAYTRRGEFMKRGYIDFKMLAYYTPRKFYTTPVLSSTTNSSEQKPETVYWAPEIKTGTSGEGTITFKLKDKIRIRLIVEGISLNGIPGYAKKILNFRGLVQ